MDLYLNMSPHDEMTTVIIGLTVIITKNKFIKFPNTTQTEYKHLGFIM